VREIPIVTLASLSCPKGLPLIIQNAKMPQYETPILDEGVHDATEEEAEYLVDKITTVTKIQKQRKGEIEVVNDRSLQWYLLKMKNTRGYCALGYSSMTQFLNDRFGQGTRRNYSYLISNAEFQKEMFDTYFPTTGSRKKVADRGDDPIYVAKSVTRPITKLPQHAWRSVWERSKEIASEKTYEGVASRFHTGKVTAKITERAAKEWMVSNGLIPPNPIRTTEEIAAVTATPAFILSMGEMNNEQVKDGFRRMRLMMADIAYSERRERNLDL
jgi:hypothetical protein